MGLGSWPPMSHFCCETVTEKNDAVNTPPVLTVYIRDITITKAQAVERLVVSILKSSQEHQVIAEIMCNEIDSNLNS
jgi:phosphoserine aminotransferase